MKLSNIKYGLFFVLSLNLIACNKKSDSTDSTELNIESLNAGLYSNNSNLRSLSHEKFIVYSISNNSNSSTLSNSATENATKGYKQTLDYGSPFEVFSQKRSTKYEMRQISRCFYKNKTTSVDFYNLTLGEICPKLGATNTNYNGPVYQGSGWLYAANPVDDATPNDNYQPLYIFQLEKSKTLLRIDIPVYMTGLADVDTITDGTLTYKRYKREDDKVTPFVLGYVNKIAGPNNTSSSAISAKKGGTDGADAIPSYPKTPRKKFNVVDKCGVFYGMTPSRNKVPVDCEVHLSVSPTNITKKNQLVEFRYDVPVIDTEHFYTLPGTKVSCNIDGIEQNSDPNDKTEHHRLFRNIPIGLDGHGQFFDTPQNTTNYRFYCVVGTPDYSPRVDYEKNIVITVTPEASSPPPPGAVYQANGQENVYFPEYYDTRNCGRLAFQVRMSQPPTDVKQLCKAAFWMPNVTGKDDENRCQYAPGESRYDGKLLLTQDPKLSENGMRWEWKCTQTISNGCWSEDAFHQLEDQSTLCSAPVYDPNQKFVPNDPSKIKLIDPW